MKIHYTLFAFLILVMSIGVLSVAESQTDVINNLRAALKAGSSRDLVKLFNNQVEMSFDGEKSGYSRTQAEFVMRDFFRKYPCTEFQYIHQGSSRQGLTYVIGKYTYEGGSFRVLVYIKKINNDYLIDLMDFSKE
ncbi:MAG: DUF4783 domain-containing protein [Cyclobacteriaceae bacterium]|nr:DUF4783 domain-containing protein [Cyclobacteriaceae bacterium]